MINNNKETTLKIPKNKWLYISGKRIAGEKNGHKAIHIIISKDHLIILILQM